MNVNELLGRAAAHLEGNKDNVGIDAALRVLKSGMTGEDIAALEAAAQSIGTRYTPDSDLLLIRKLPGLEKIKKNPPIPLKERVDLSRRIDPIEVREEDSLSAPDFKKIINELFKKEPIIPEVIPPAPTTARSVPKGFTPKSNDVSPIPESPERKEFLSIIDEIIPRPEKKNFLKEIVQRPDRIRHDVLIPKPENEKIIPKPKGKKS